MTGPSRRSVTIAGLGVAAAALGAATPARADDGGLSRPTWAWLLGQLGSGTRVTTASQIAPDRDYPVEWTEAVAGSVSLVDIELPPERLRVEQAVVTDRVYRLGDVAVGADGRFRMDWSRPGLKVFRLRDAATGDVLAEHAPRTGLLRSFAVPEAHALAGRAFSYDQALGLLTAVVLGEHAAAATFASGLIGLQTAGGPQDGGFVTSAAALFPAGAAPEYRTGNHAVATYALLRYLRDVPAADEQAPVLAAASRAVAWLLAQQEPGGPLAGLVRGGHGAYLGGGFDPGHRLPWASTEHNLDAWHTLRLAERVLGDREAGAAAERLADAVDDLLWSPQEQRFWQGRSPEGPDTAHALDVSSWGALFLVARGRDAQARTALENLAWFATTDRGASGYAPVPFATPPLVWVEGTAGVSLAQLRVGLPDDARATLRAVEPISTDGAWPASTRDDPGLSMTSAPAVAAAAWIVLLEQALAGRDSIWDDENEVQR